MTHSPDSVSDVLSRLTLQEKLDLLDGEDFWHTTPVERLGISAILMSDGPHGLRTQPETSDALGIWRAHVATCFPPAAATASSWDVHLLEQIGGALAREARALGVSVVLGPGINMKRSPLCGRNFEYFSEDPYLAGELGAAMVTGIQDGGVGASLKHFAANNQESHRMTVSADVDERTLREIYLTGFERVVRAAQPWTVMCSYNRINGVFASQDRWLLTDVLRQEWGFEGLVVSDWGAVYDRAVALTAGMDLEMPTSEGNGATRVAAALAAGTLTEDDIDRAVHRILHLVCRSQPASGNGQTYDAQAHHELARDAAAASIVLLKNDNAVLPLTERGGTVALIGEFARTPRYQGGGSSKVTTDRVDSLLDALPIALPARDITFAAGFSLEDDVEDAVAERLLDEAVAQAQDADVAIVCLGLPDAWESEGYDRDHMLLPPQQIAVLRAVSDVVSRVVVVLSNGSVVEVAPWQDAADAICETWLLGQAGGMAVADVLTGAVNPSGKLAETIPIRHEDTPAFTTWPGTPDAQRYGEGLFIGYRWYAARRLPVAYPFGHGLSYTTFAYTDLDVTCVRDGADPLVRVGLSVTNTGSREGAEVVQLYVHDVESSEVRPEAELKAFEKVSLAPGESRRVEFELGQRAFAFWSEVVRRWIVEAGTFEIRVAASSLDVRQTARLELSGEPITAPLTLDSEAELWLADPTVGPQLREAIAGTPAADMLFHPESGRMMRAIPLLRLSRFPTFPLNEDDLTEMLQRARTV